MNRIIVTGNGFDLSYGLNTRYTDFINWLWKKLNTLYNDHIKSSSENLVLDELLTYIPYSKPEAIEHTESRPKRGVFYDEKVTREICKIEYINKFLDILTRNSALNTWVDIEAEYFKVLDICLNNNYIGGVEQLNKDFNKIKKELAIFISEELKNKNIKNFNINHIGGMLNVADFSSTGKKIIKELYFSEDHSKYEQILENIQIGDFNYPYSEVNVNPENILFLNFNYTDLPSKIVDIISNLGEHRLTYYGINSTITISIHGELNNAENPMIFGYGDEQNNIHEKIEQSGGAYLDNIKTINYLKTSNYKNLLSFIESDYYQVFIWGHSCGFSDKTLLKTLFEHEHCVSIKPFYYEWEDDNQVKHNNYDDLLKNIYRIFSDKMIMRDKVVPKTYCQSLPQNV